MLSSNQPKLETIKKALQSIGYSIEEAEKQIEEVGKVITMAILHKLLQKHSGEKLTPQGLENFLKVTYNAQYIRTVIDEESNNIVTEYLKEITMVLPADQKETFARQVRENSTSKVEVWFVVNCFCGTIKIDNAFDSYFCSIGERI